MMIYTVLIQQTLRRLLWPEKKYRDWQGCIPCIHEPHQAKARSLSIFCHKQYNYALLLHKYPRKFDVLSSQKKKNNYIIFSAHQPYDLLCQTQCFHDNIHVHLNNGHDPGSQVLRKLQNFEKKSKQFTQYAPVFCMKCFMWGTSLPQPALMHDMECKEKYRTYLSFKNMILFYDLTSFEMYTGWIHFVKGCCRKMIDLGCLWMLLCCVVHLI